MDNGEDRGKVLVVGGGIAGMRAALELSYLAHDVCLVEKTDELGGLVSHLGRVYPTMESSASVIGTLLEAVDRAEGIEVLLRSKLTKLEGSAGDFAATIATPSGTKEMGFGAVIVASGLAVHDPSGQKEYRYSSEPNVVTILELDRVLKDSSATSLERPDGKGEVASVAFIQCVGSRSERYGAKYCSNYCCMAAIKEALHLKKMKPEMSVHIFYMDIRAFEKGAERLYTEAKQAGVRFIRGIPSDVVSTDGKLRLHGENTLLKELYDIEADLVVLSVGLVPSRGRTELAEILDIELDEDGLYRSPGPLRAPMETSREGIFMAGTCEAPKGIRESLAQASAAALRAHELVS